MPSSVATAVGAVFASLALYLRQRIKRAPGNVSVVLLGGPPNLGKDKWLGGELGADGNIYGIPGSAKFVLKITPSTGRIETIGPPLIGPTFKTSLRRNCFKWLRGICVQDGTIYGLPSNAERVLKITPGGGEVSVIGPSFKGIWKWHGGVLAGDGNIYGIPCNADAVLKVNTKTGKVTTFGGPLIGRQKWYGGLLGSDGCIYGIPNCADSVLKIDPRTSTVSMIGNLPAGGFKWHGGVVGADQCIYGIPSHANTVLKIVPSTGQVIQLTGPLDTLGKLPSKTGKRKGRCQYKYGGGVMGSDGCIYALPSDADRVLRIELKTGKLSLVGPRLPGRNKWQNGFLGADGAVYAIPCNAEKVLRISKHGVVALVGKSLTSGVEKWEGGVVARDGTMYCVPQQSDQVLKIVPCPDQ